MGNDTPPPCLATPEPLFSKPAQTALIIPTRNASDYLLKLLPALARQTLKPDEFLVIDSHSTDDTVQLCKDAGATVRVIQVDEFNHGGTRRWASELVTADILIYLTQDAIPATADSLKTLRDAVLASPQVGSAYGRQIPHLNAGLLGAHARNFNYPVTSKNKCLSDIPQLGIKTCFSSDSFSAYRKSTLDEVGGFPRNVIGSEDAYVASRMLLAGWTIRYEADAVVYHSHDYSLFAEFKRYFDIGVFYGREKWISQYFGSARGEGFRFIASELKMLLNNKAYQGILEMPIRTALKVLGYRLGKAERYLPLWLKRHISSFSGYWT